MPQTAAQKRAVAKWRKETGYGPLAIQLRKSDRDLIRKTAYENSVSLNKLILYALKETYNLEFEGSDEV